MNRHAQFFGTTASAMLQLLLGSWNQWVRCVGWWIWSTFGIKIFLLDFQNIWSPTGGAYVKLGQVMFVALPGFGK